MIYAGLLCYLDKPSDGKLEINRAQGFGRRVEIPYLIGSQSLNALVGVPLAEEHYSVSAPIGRVLYGWIDANDIWVRAETEKPLPEGLGLSLEAENVQVEDLSARIYRISCPLEFTRVATVRSGAYRRSSLKLLEAA